MKQFHPARLRYRRPPYMRRLIPGVPLAEHRKTRETWGESCPDYEPGCVVCDAWEFLRTRGYTMPERDYSKAEWERGDDLAP